MRRARQTRSNRRRFLLAAGGAVAGIGLAGCTDDDEGGDDAADAGDDDQGGDDHDEDDDTGDDEGAGAVANAEPMGEAVDSTAVSWSDLGDLEGELTIYSGRTRDQIDPVFAALEEEYDGLTLNVDYDENDVQVNQIVQEGEATPADLMYSQDPGALNALEDEGVLQTLPGDVVDAVPGSFRHPDGLWTGVTGRTRSIQFNADRLAEETDFESGDELPTDIVEYATDERFRGIIATRPNSGTFRGFIQAMVELEGEEETREWVRAMVEDQDVQLFSGGSDMAEAISRGGDDDPIVALGNSYYAARILNEDPDAPIDLAFTENDAGCLFSVAGVGVLNDVEGPELVAEFVRHLLAAEGQEFMMEANGEYPVVEGVDYVGELPDLEEIDPPEFDLSEFDMALQDARDLLTEEGMTV
ncbi:extracellular solute-binding protein [Natronorarus salvus]|uniref:extracellular solute-binding protein n=1 Tax=Natronorarus salvus TaxID=3117733 RepID=UPI002F26035B